ncbi:MAG TPA: hypothetical protein VGJ41_13220 [Nocardioides sp.]
MDDVVERAFAAGLVQPDARSCGPSALVVARLVNDAAFARTMVGDGSGIVERFRREVLALHRRTNRMRLTQIGWPRALGTQPWALAAELSAHSGVPGGRYEVRTILPGRRAAAWDRLQEGLAARHLVAGYVGSRILPRHVVLALSGDDRTARVYDPASGRRVTVTREAFVAGKLRGCGGWPVPWAVITPRL